MDWDKELKRKDWYEWSWERWCAYLRKLVVRREECEVQLMVALMALENRPEIWANRGLGFAKLIKHPAHLSLPISPTRYDTYKAAIKTFGPKIVAKIGLRASIWMSKLRDPKLREVYASEAEVWARNHNRPLSDAAARAIYVRIMPEDKPAAVETWREKLWRAEAKIAELERQLAEREARIGRLVAYARYLEQLLRRHKIPYESPKTGVL